MEHAGLLHLQPTTITYPGLILIPLLPLAAFAVNILIGRRLGKLSAWLSVAALAGSWIFSMRLAPEIFRHNQLALQWAWLWPGQPQWSVGLNVDGLSWVMLFVVTTIAPMIAIYSIGYMHEDSRFSRFFAYFSLFCASMLGLVMADHLVLFYACWELVGLCSYLLISFWFEKPAAAAAGRKAFLTTRIGDTGLFLGILLLYFTAQTLHFRDFDLLGSKLPVSILTAISLLVFLGAVGKSAQFPLHVWLPDAMEGPTPVSALIHAATMVAAGVYLVARSSALFTPQSLQIVLAIGLFTHLFAGTIALTMTDIKRILAYSTLSQLGLMMTALGLGAVPAAMFHLMTHAFFKALLFLGAGSVIHATHQQELSRLGGLSKQMPWTSFLVGLAALSMSGGIFLSGFWSKDAILLAAWHEKPWLMWVLAAGAVMTTAYVFRLYLRCFFGETPQLSGHHDHPAHARLGGHEERAGESPAIMVLPMSILGAGAAFVGLAAGSPWGHALFDALGVHEEHKFSLFMTGLSLAILFAGLSLAWIVGFKRRNLLPQGLRPLGRAFYTLAANKYSVDEFYEAAVIKPFVSFARWCAQMDQLIIDGAVNGVGWAGVFLSEVEAWVDRVLVDGLVNAMARTTRDFGVFFRIFQTGIIQQYLFVVVAAVVVLSIAIRRF